MALAKLLASNTTNNTAPSPAFSDTAPASSSSARVIALTGGADSVRLYPYGVGSDGGNFLIYVFRWYASADDYLASPQGIYTATFGTATGTANGTMT